MTSFTHSAHRSPAPLSHCFSPSDLMPLLRAHSKGSGGPDLIGASAHLTGTGSGDCFQGLLFYLSPDDFQAEHQLGAISGLLHEFFLWSLIQ